MKEEDGLLKKVGVRNPFEVPEGYFENFTSDLMRQLPEKSGTSFAVKAPTLWDKVKPWVYMAAMFAGAALIIRVASSQQGKPEVLPTDEAVREMEYISTVVDNSMLDDYSLYVYLTSTDEDDEDISE